MSKKTSTIFYIFIIAAIVATRLLPHLWNFAPITAVAIFAGMYLPKKQALALPLAARFVSDLFLGFFSPVLMLAVYFCHLFGAALGIWVRKDKSLTRVIGAPVISAAVFFFITNFAWFYSTYPHNLSGIILAYTNGLPFLRGTLLGDVAYTLALVGGYEAVLYYQARRAGVSKVLQKV